MASSASFPDSHRDRSSIPDIVYDEDRLSALERQDILDTEPEPAFDRITQLATDLLGVPVALVNFVGEERQWVKSKIGFDEREVGLDVSFCVYTIDEGGPMVIENAAENERFASNSLVQEKGLRFYAGVPLESEDGHSIGTLCVLSDEPRSPSEEELRQLTDFAATVEDALRLRREAARRRQSERRKEMQSTFLEAIATGTASEDVLKELCREVQRWFSGGRLSVLELEDDRLRHVAAPSLPDEYVEAIDGLEVGPSVATCGTAAHTGQAVVTEDVFEDERWEGYRDLISSTRLRSCWSVPFRGASGEVLGTFAVYQTESKTPSPEEKHLIDRMAHVASVALERDRHQAALRESEERFRTVVENAQPVVFMTDQNGTFLLSEGDDLEVLGLQPGEAVGQSAFEIFDGYPEVTERFRQTLNEEEVDAEVNIGGTILNAWACPFHDENGNVAGCIGMATDVTERRTQKRQLEETKEQYRTLIDHFPGAVFLYNEDLRCVLTGGEALEEVGMNAEEIEGAIPRERYPPEIADPLEDRLQAALSGEQSVMEQSYQGRHFRIETLPIQEGETCMAVSVDITERKKAQQALKRSQERLTMALEGGEIGTWDWDLETGEVIFNRQWAEMLGYTRQELDFHFSTWEALVHPEDLPRAMTMLDKYIQGDRDTYNPEIRMQTKSGDWKWVQTIGKVIDRDESGEMTRAAGIHLDIDERKKAERELRRSEQRFRKIFENAAIGIAIVNDEGWPLRANPALQSMLGYSEEELRALHFSEVTHPDDIEKDLGLFEELNEEERDEYQIDKRYVRKDGEVFWGRLIVSRLDLDDGTKHVSLVENISEQKQHERAIRQAKDEAEEAARLKSIMLANMSHEVRTPLTSMIGLSGLLTKQLEGRAAKLARLIQKSGKRLEETMESALQLSQLEAGSYTPAHTTLSLPSLARRIVDEFELDAKDSGVSLQVETPGKPTEAYVDEMAVRRVISNLVDNAIKFTPENGHVTIRTYAKDSNMVTVEVEDTGVGISEEALPRIFQAFQQESEGLTREYEGVGLGLSIVRKLVEALGGRIEVDTEKGRGTCMSVHLPRPNESKSS